MQIYDNAICVLNVRFVVYLVLLMWVVSWVLGCAGGCGMSDVYMLKSVGERTPP